jgi:hypothetical protein
MKCRYCDGSGRAFANDPPTGFGCEYCNGKGEIEMNKEKVIDAFESVYGVRLTDENEILDTIDEINDRHRGNIDEWIKFEKEVLDISKKI